MKLKFLVYAFVSTIWFDLNADSLTSATDNFAASLSLVEGRVGDKLG